MLKNKTKFVVILLAFLLVVSTFSFATDTPVTTSVEGEVTSTLPGDNTRTVEPISETNTTTDTTTETQTEATTESEIYNGDLYIFDDNIEMNQLVDGNVFLFGNNINVTGKVNGSLYAFCDTITFSEESYVVQSIYAIANQLTLNGCANDLYACAKKIDMSYNSFMIRDLRVIANTFNFNGGVGRDAFVEADNFNFVTTENSAAIVYGNLTYSSDNELTLTTELVQGTINYSKDSLVGSSDNVSTLVNSANFMNLFLQLGSLVIVIVILTIIGLISIIGLIVFLIVYVIKKSKKSKTNETAKVEEKTKKEKKDDKKDDKKSE